jgi:hypothetical protein
LTTLAAERERRERGRRVARCALDHPSGRGREGWLGVPLTTPQGERGERERKVAGREAGEAGVLLAGAV